MGDSGDCGGGGCGGSDHGGGGGGCGSAGGRDYGGWRLPGSPEPLPRQPPPGWLLALGAAFDAICSAAALVLKPIVITLGIVAGLAFAACVAVVLGFGLFEAGAGVVHLL